MPWVIFLMHFTPNQLQLHEHSAFTLHYKTISVTMISTG